MRRLTLLLLFSVTIAATAAPRPFIKEFAPSTIAVGSGERYLGIVGGNFTSGAQGPVAIIDGPAGHFEVEPSSIRGFEPEVSLQVWVPAEIIYTVGRYSVFVRNAVNGDSDKAYLDVRGDSQIEITAPPYVTVPATGPAGAVVTYQASARSTTGAAVTLSCAPASGSTFPLGATSVRCDASMADGSTRTTNFPVTVFDNTPPQLTLPANTARAATSNAGALVDFIATATDTVDTDVAVVCEPYSGSQFRIGTTEVRCSARDDSGNVANGTFFVTITSTQHPTIFLPADFTVAGTSSIGADVTFHAYGKDWQGATIRAWCMPETGSTFSIGTTEVMCSTTDDWNRTTNGNFRVTVTAPGGKPPVLSLPGNIAVQAAYGTGSAQVTFNATAHDETDGVLPVTCTPPSGSMFAVGTHTVHCSATDSQNLTAHGSFEVTVSAFVEKPPVLSLPADITAYAAAGQQGANVWFTVSARDDVDGLVAVSCSPPSGYFFPLGTSSVMCTASDHGSRSSMGMFNVTVLVGANLPPVLTLPADFTVTAPTPRGAVVTFTATAQDDHDGAVPVSCGPSSGATFPVGTFTVTCIATDSQKLSTIGTFKVTILSPNEPPNLWIPSGITVEATSSAGAVVTYEALAHDDHDGEVSIACTPGSGSTFPIGMTTVTCSATDSRNATSTGTFKVTVTPPANQPPVLTLPADITVQGSGSAGAVVTFNATATDDHDGSLAVSCTPASGSTFAVGTTTVTCSATDSQSLTTTGTFKVTVTAPANEPPVLTLPADITVAATSSNGAVVTFTATATDDHDGSLAVSCTPASGSTFAVGTTTVTCSATDSQSLTTTGTFRVTVTAQPNQPPVLTLPADITVQATSSSGAVVTFTATATDDHDGSLAVSCTPASGSTFAIGTTTVMCSATDSQSLTTAGTFHVVVTRPADSAPSLALPADLTVEATSPDGTPVTFTVLANDALDGVLPAACSPSSGSAFALGETTVSCSATNSRGLTTTGTFRVTVVDTTGPTIISLSASPSRLWPVNKRLFDITVTVSAEDGSDPLPTARIIAILVNEAVPADDWSITGVLTARLRADRNGQEKPRIYTLVVEITDASGNVSTATIDVVVPHDESDKASTPPPTTRRRSARH
ncbi:MAG TPA: HYR domain-containing protein [Thermoanaerobaculia bacterium]